MMLKTKSNRPRRGSAFHLESAFALFGKSQRLVRKHIWIFGPLYILPLIFSFHSWIWTPAPESHTGRAWWTDYSWFGSGFSASSMPTYLWYLVVGFSFLWFLIVVAGGTIAQILSQEAQLQAASGNGTITFAKLWPAVKQLGWKMLGLYFLIGIYVAVPIFILLLLVLVLGAIGFIFTPIIIFSFIMLRRYFLAPYIMLDKRTGIADSMDASAVMTSRHPYAIWSVIGVMVLIGCANAIWGVGWLVAFVLGSLYSVAPALRYQELKKLV